MAGDKPRTTNTYQIVGICDDWAITYLCPRTRVERLAVRVGTGLRGHRAFRKRKSRVEYGARDFLFRNDDRAELGLDRPVDLVAGEIHQLPASIM